MNGGWDGGKIERTDPFEHDNLSETGSVQTQAVERPWNIRPRPYELLDELICYLFSAMESLLLCSCRVCLSADIV